MLSWDGTQLDGRVMDLEVLTCIGRRDLMDAAMNIGQLVQETMPLASWFESMPKAWWVSAADVTMGFNFSMNLSKNTSPTQFSTNLSWKAGFEYAELATTLKKR